MYEELSGLEKKYKINEFPLSIGLEVTNHCNLNCVMCTNDKLTRKKGYMDMELYRKIVDEVAEVSPGTRLWLDFCGEPLLAGYRLYFMIDYARKKGIKNICINTNGTLLKKEYADMLLDSGIDNISIDCDGYSKEVYESIRVGGNRDVFYANVEYILAEKKRRNITNTIVEVKVLDQERNHHEVQQIMDYWRERGAWTAKRRLRTWAGDVDRESETERPDRIACGYAVGICPITWDGFVPCCADDADAKYTWGNVKEESIQSIWQRRNSEFVALHMEHQWDGLNEMCQKCNDWMIVGEMRYDENGTLINRNYNAKSTLYQKNED